MPSVLRNAPAPASAFTPTSLNDVFALYLARELSDVSRVASYAGLTRTYSLCLLLNALKRARKKTRPKPPTATHFHMALQELSSEEEHV